LPHSVLACALQEARSKGYLGEHVLNSGFSLQIHSTYQRRTLYLRGGKRRCSTPWREKRATPRAKPPFPLVSGLWGKPTVVNNVETLCKRTHILHYGVECIRVWREASIRTKLFGASGRVKDSGLWNCQWAPPFGKFIENMPVACGDGYKLRGFFARRRINRLYAGPNIWM